MNVAYAGDIFNLQKAGGINRYFCEVITHLPSEIRATIFGASTFGTHLPTFHPGLRCLDGPSFRPVRLSYALRVARWKWLLNRSADVLHPTYYDLVDNLDLDSISTPVVVTVYDMIYAKHPHHFPEAQRVIDAQRRFVERADHVVCISKFTEMELHEVIPSSRGKTTVAYLASEFSGESYETGQPTSDSFLFVGGRKGYKNFSFLLTVFAEVSRGNPALKLVVAGSPLDEKERREISAAGLGDKVVSLIFPDEQRLRALYRESLALVYPSSMEGFGLPPLEAFSCGTLVVTSNACSLPEVMGDAGIMLEPEKFEAWVECLRAIAARKIDRDAYIERGFEQAKRFSWKTTADIHASIYRALAPNA